tara:strand:- start:1341 stop:1988 length:648 start_codon:yes stop_codon:yes gene_type:complete
MSIPKIIHQIWVGDQSKRPVEMMETWKEKNPTWDYRFWSEENIPKLRNQAQFDAMNELAGKADILRYELLYDHGGFFIDADSVCVNALDDFFTENKAFCCWENEQIREGLMSNGYFATEKNSPLAERLIARIGTYPVEEVAKLPNLTAWQVVGPVLLTDTVRSMPECGMNVYPSHYFIPRHYTGLQYEGNDKIYAEQYWGSTETMNGKMGMQYGS